MPDVTRPQPSTQHFNWNTSHLYTVSFYVTRNDSRWKNQTFTYMSTQRTCQKIVFDISGIMDDTSGIMHLIPPEKHTYAYTLEACKMLSATIVTVALYWLKIELSLLFRSSLARLGCSVGCAVRLETRRPFVEIDREIFCMVILSLLLIQEGQLSVSGERMCTILVNCLED